MPAAAFPGRQHDRMRLAFIRDVSAVGRAFRCIKETRSSAGTDSPDGLPGGSMAMRPDRRFAISLAFTMSPLVIG